MTEARVMMAEMIRELGSESINRSFGFFDNVTPEYDLHGYLGLMTERTHLLRAWLVFLEEIPLIVGPVSNIAPFRPNEDIATPDKAERIFRAHGLLVSINLLGLPSAVVSTGLHNGFTPINPRSGK